MLWCAQQPSTPSKSMCVDLSTSLSQPPFKATTHIDMVTTTLLYVEFFLINLEICKTENIFSKHVCIYGLAGWQSEAHHQTWFEFEGISPLLRRPIQAHATFLLFRFYTFAAHLKLIVNVYSAAIWDTYCTFIISYEASSLYCPYDICYKFWFLLCF